MGKFNTRQAGQWIIGLMILLTACSDSVSPAATASPAPSVTQIAQQPGATASPTRTTRPTVTPSPAATVFSGILPTQSDIQAVSNAVIIASPIQNNRVIFGRGTEYSVVPGDSLTIIANRYRVTVDDLLVANGLLRSEIIVPGQVLRIPLPTMTPSTTPTSNWNRRDMLSARLTATAQALTAPDNINELSYDAFIDLPDGVQQRVRAIFARGQLMGRNPRAFTRIGDSTIEPPHFFYRFDGTGYHLGDYTYLQPTIDHYAGSFGHDSVAVIRGLHTWSVFDPMWTPSQCNPGEHLLACEFRLHNPAILMIRLGTNDRGMPDITAEYYENIVRYSIEQGVIPVIGTKADRFDGADSPVNAIMREIAAKYQVPLWDFDLVASTLPSNGLTTDNIHLSVFYAHDWRQPRGFTTGHGLHNLTGLIVLDELLQILPSD